MRILLVEDEAEMAGALASALKRYDMVVDHAPTLAEAEEARAALRGRWEEDPSDEERLRIVEEAIPHVERQLALVRSRQETLEEFARELEAKLRRLRRRRRELS